MNKAFDLGHIGILMGGYSSERDISLKSGTNVSQALKDSGCQVSDIDIISEEKSQIRDQINKTKIDVAFISLHGALGEDGTIQSILEKEGIPYTGSGINASQLVINKVKTQKLLKDHHISVPDNKVIKKCGSLIINDILMDFHKWPVVIKPSCEGSSFGITIVKEKDKLETAINAAFKYGDELLCEEYINGRELTVGILGEDPLPIIEIRPKNNFFDFTAKYQKGMTEYIIPAELDQGLASKIQQIAKDSHLCLGCRDFSRVDIILDDKNNPFVIEINTIPGFTTTSLVPMAANHIGMDFSNFCIKLVEMAYEKKK